MGAVIASAKRLQEFLVVSCHTRRTENFYSGSLRISTQSAILQLRWARHAGFCAVEAVVGEFFRLSRPWLEGSPPFWLMLEVVTPTPRLRRDQSRGPLDYAGYEAIGALSVAVWSLGRA